VSVNGVTITQLGSTADADVDRITVDGKALNLKSELVYLIMNKPTGVLTTSSDPQRRRTVIDLLPPGLPPHVLPVGRLDLDTEGLLMFTNDGEFAHRLTHPRYELDKEYHALVGGRPSEKTLAALERGVDIGDYVTSPAEASAARPPAGHAEVDGASWISLVIHEGRKRQVRLMCAKIGHPVRELVRTRVGAVALGGLKPGEVRSLTETQLASLRKAMGLK
jgi:pseudouridine synthase